MIGKPENRFNRILFTAVLLVGRQHTGNHTVSVPVLYCQQFQWISQQRKIQAFVSASLIGLNVGLTLTVHFAKIMKKSCQKCNLTFKGGMPQIDSITISQLRNLDTVLE